MLVTATKDKERMPRRLNRRTSGFGILDPLSDHRNHCNPLIADDIQ